MARDDIVEVSLTVPRGKTTRELTETVQSLVGSAGGALKDLDEVVVNRGPGSLTGIRVGIAFARSLALALGIPVIGVSGLDALAFAALACWFAREWPDSVTLVSALHATAGQVFYATYRARMPAPERTSDYFRVPASEFLKHLRHLEPAIIAGDATNLVTPRSSSISLYPVPTPLLPTPESLLMASRYFPDPYADPLYLFPPVREKPR